MARKIVTQYAVFHNIGSTSEIVFYYQGGGAVYPDPDCAGYNATSEVPRG